MIKYINEERAKEGLAICNDDKPLTKDSFCKVWNKRVPYVKIAKSVSDFCDTCTKYKFMIDMERNLFH